MFYLELKRIHIAEIKVKLLTVLLTNCFYSFDPNALSALKGEGGEVNES
jgi:hypothetical protein